MVSIEGRPDWEEGIAVIEAALEAGACVVDTADAYCIASPREHGYGERLVGEALRRRRGAYRPLVATKGGEWRPGDGSWQLDGRPDHLRSSCDASLRRLRVDVIDLYQLHRPDPAVPLTESMGALADLREAGKIKEIGICNVTLAELDEALAAAPIAAVQNPMWFGGPRQDDVLGRCEQLGLTFLAHSPLGGPAGLGRIGSRSVLEEVAARNETTAHVVALAWLVARSPMVVPIPGTTRPERAVGNVAAARLTLPPPDLAELSGS
jgi:aryl-alcohol dehydrogenase-like predicted oxidoreductase